MRLTILLATVTFLSGSTIAAQESVTIASSPEDLSRPVATLLDQLRQREKIAVTYEDPRYNSKAEIQDVTSEVSRNTSAVQNEYGPRILIPKGKAITFVYAPQDLESANGTKAVIERMLREYALLGGSTFSVVGDGVRLHVIPNAVLSTGGDRIKQRSILDTFITVPPGRRTTSQLLQLICDEVRQETGYKIDVGPSDPTRTNITSQSADHQTVRAIIGQLLDGLATPGAYVWDLYYDPSDGTYGLNFSYIGPAGPGHNSVSRVPYHAASPSEQR